MILLSHDLESIPFDVRVFRYIIYKQSIQGSRELQSRLREAIKAVAEKSFRCVMTAPPREVQRLGGGR